MKGATVKQVTLDVTDMDKVKIVSSQAVLKVSLFLLLLLCVSLTITGQPRTASSSAECSRDKPPFSFVRGQDSTM